MDRWHSGSSARRSRWSRIAIALRHWSTSLLGSVHFDDLSTFFLTVALYPYTWRSAMKGWLGDCGANERGCGSQIPPSIKGRRLLRGPFRRFQTTIAHLRRLYGWCGCEKMMVDDRMKSRAEAPSPRGRQSLGRAFLPRMQPIVADLLHAG